MCWLFFNQDICLQICTNLKCQRCYPLSALLGHLSLIIITHILYTSSALNLLIFANYYLLQEILQIVNENVFCKATHFKLISSLFNCVSNHCRSIDMCLNASPMSSMSSSPDARNLSDSDLAMLYCASETVPLSTASPK